MNISIDKFNMNISINKLYLPYDMKRVINSYYSNEFGYTGEELKAIEKIKDKRINKFIKLRQKLELATWYKMGVSVSWLRPTRYDDGVYGVYGKQHPNKVYGGGTKAESRYFRDYNKENDYIEKLVEDGDWRRI